MEMVASAYEQQLIEESEKADFYEKLSKLSETELYDPAVLSGMKRTLSIILENGSMASPMDSIENADNETSNYGRAEDECQRGRK